MFSILFSVLLCPLIIEAITNSTERIVTEQQDILFGVPIDYSYNQTGNGTLSSPGCPKSDFEYPWVYCSTQNGAQCFLTGQRGPCPVDQKLFLEKKGNLFGYCNCNCFESFTEVGYTNTSVPFCGSFQGYFAFHSDIKTCFQLYSQGPCKDGEWLIKSEKSTGPHTLCEKRKCDENQVPELVDGKFSACTTPMSFPIIAFSPIRGVIPNGCNDASCNPETSPDQIG